MNRRILTIDCGDGQVRADNGCKGPVVAKTASYTVTLSDAGKVFTNKGAVGTIVFTLPAPKAGVRFMFCVIAAQTLTITATGGAKINAGSANGSLGAAGSQALAGSAEVFSPDGANWLCTTLGTWA